MKNKQTTRQTENETTEFIKNSIVEWWQLFVEDYPKNRQDVLDYFDEAIEWTTRERVKLFWANLKKGFLEAEKTL